MSTTLPYALVDVFAQAPLEGNQLAIFTDARGLSSEQMQALARETNLAETTFILPQDDPSDELDSGVRVRIFTTQEELPFAGHPTLGTAAWLFLNHPTLRGQQEITLALQQASITVRFQPTQPGSPGVYGTMRQLDPLFGDRHDPATIAAILNVPLTDLDTRYPIQTVNTGMPFCIVPFRSVQALSRLAIPQSTAQPWLDQADAKFFYCLAPAQHGPAAFRARMQFYNGEDPATGSAAGCAISWLVEYGLVRSDIPILIEQGIEIRRPSHLHVQATREAAKIHSVFVGGSTVPVASGHFFLS